jgi:hypothetical protein
MNQRWLPWIVTMFLVLEWAAIPLRADSKPQRPEIKAEQIRKVLAASGVQVTPEQLEMLCAVSATQPAPQLKLVSLTTLDETTTRARLQCENASVCLPFYVLLHWQTSGAAQASLKAWGNAEETKPEPSELLVYNGKVATMIFAGEHVRITQPVLCLQNGARGQQIRVASLDRQRIWQARVTGAGIVMSGGLN